jgi:hypothetical protein
MEGRFMKIRFVVLVLGILVLGEATNSASGSPLFAKALKEKYNLRTVSCYTCHAQTINPQMPVGKEVRNDFGKLFADQLVGKMIVARMADSKNAAEAAQAAEDAGNMKLADELRAKKEQIDAGITKDFHDALLKVEPQKHSSGDTYQKILQAGDLERLKPKE